MPKSDQTNLAGALAERVRKLGENSVRDVIVVDVPCDRAPWIDTGLHLEQGDQVTGVAFGRTYLKQTSISIGPSFQLWYRISDDGEIFRGTRDTHTFEAEQSGRLHLASYFPGEWGTTKGALGVPEEVYAQAEGSFSVVLVRWNCNPVEGLRALDELGDMAGLVASELDRLTNPILPPEGWYYKWFVGPAEIYRSVETPGRRAAISCRTHSDCGLLLRDVTLPLEPGTHLRWSWKTDVLPSKVPENTLPTHDYMSIAVEFDNGQDITYFWSAALPVETGFRCPIPIWDTRETHVAIRSGPDGLGQWLEEDRELYADYVRYIGGPAGTKIVRVWLIALTLFQRQEGVASFADITLTTAAGDTIAV